MTSMILTSCQTLSVQSSAITTSFALLLSRHKPGRHPHCGGGGGMDHTPHPPIHPATFPPTQKARRGKICLPEPLAPTHPSPKFPTGRGEGGGGGLIGHRVSQIPPPLRNTHTPAHLVGGDAANANREAWSTLLLVAVVVSVQSLVMIFLSLRM